MRVHGTVTSVSVSVIVSVIISGGVGDRISCCVRIKICQFGFC